MLFGGAANDVLDVELLFLGPEKPGFRADADYSDFRRRKLSRLSMRLQQLAARAALGSFRQLAGLR